MTENKRDHLLVLLCKHTADKKLTRRERSQLHKWLRGHRHQLDFNIYEDYLLDLGAAEQETEASWQLFRSKYGDVVDLDTPVAPAGAAAGQHNVYWMTGYAAAVIIVLLTGAYFLFNTNKRVEHAATTVAATTGDIEPGGFKATLTLGNHSTITLDTVKPGSVITQGNTEISQPKKGELVYEIKTAPGAADAITNELATPRGGKYLVVLPDGSRVELNAESSLRYTSAFTGNERSVALSGEAWFEIAKNEQKPFRLTLGEATIEVLGTHFNVHAYKDEMKQTTLISGNIRVKTTNSQWTPVKPGQQALVDNEQHIKIDNASPEAIRQAVAWKNDSIYYESARLDEIMRQLERWYNMDVKYKDPIGNKLVKLPPLSRNENISTILKNLEAARILSYGIEGRTVTLSAPAIQQ